jgi:hypothetical protein
MGDLVKNKLDPELAKTITVTWFVYPGSHDCATYKDGLADFSYQCQEKNLYEQMKTGQRAFDLRLAPKDDKFIPVHGVAKGTGDDFSQGPKKANENDIAKQVMKFAKEHPSEIIILKINFEDLNTPEQKLLFANTVYNLLGERLLRAPNKDEKNPTYHEAVESNRNIIVATSTPNTQTGHKDHEMAKYYWDAGANTANWMGDGNEMLWNEPVWTSGDLKKVLKSTEDWIEKNQERAAARNKFWMACAQLTPALGQGFVTFLKEGASVRPKDLALGGGIGTKGSFKGSNKELRDSGTLKTALWRKHASCILYDFCDTDTTGHIVAMNLMDGADDDGPSGGGGGEAGGRGGGGGGSGRGGHHGGGDGADDHPGRGGHHGGDGADDHPGRGGHRGGRGRGHD